MEQADLNQPNNPLQKPTIIQAIEKRIPIKIKVLLFKFYSKKIIFWPTTISFGLIFLIIILGVIFGKDRNQATPPTTPSPTPTIGFENPEEETTLTKTESDLEILKNRINSLDVTQGKLKPPVLNFDVSF